VNRRVRRDSIKTAEQQKTAFCGEGEKQDDEGNDARHLQPKQGRRQSPEQ
jgi:hypothetical protein